MQRIVFAIYSGCLLLASASVSLAREKKSDEWFEVVRADPRLQARVNYHFKKRATEEEFFGILQKASGVKLSIEPQEVEGKVTFGSIQGVNAPVWMVMKTIATNQVIDGYWEKTDDGYVLHGKPKEKIGMFVLTPEAEKAQLEKERIAEAARARKSHRRALSELLSVDYC